MIFVFEPQIYKLLVNFKSLACFVKKVLSSERRTDRHIRHNSGVLFGHFGFETLKKLLLRYEYECPLQKILFISLNQWRTYRGNMGDISPSMTSDPEGKMMKRRRKIEIRDLFCNQLKLGTFFFDNQFKRKKYPLHGPSLGMPVYSKVFD